jgi:hypothetical protein
MNDDDVIRLQMAVDTADKAVKAIMDDMTEVFSKMQKTWICGLCGRDHADRWLATTCVDEHIETTRVCQQCCALNGLGITRNCVNCGKRTLDWALKTDSHPRWSCSWIDQ